jgi:hypothetical protein
MVAIQSNERGLTRSSVEEDKFKYQSIWGFQKIHGLFLIVYKNYKQEQQQHSIEVKRTNQVSISTALTSRNAENLFWVGRLSERTMALTSVLK